MSSKSKDNTCPTCGKKKYDPSCGHFRASGQQEDNTGHPTAETPDAQPLENVSGENFVTCWRCKKQFKQYPNMPMGAVLCSECEAYRKDYANAPVFVEQPDGELKQIYPPEALPSNNASESDQIPSPSEQEDKPTIDCDCVAHQMGCDVPVPDSKPEKPLMTQEQSAQWLEDHLDEVVDSSHSLEYPSKPDQLSLDSILDYIEQHPNFWRRSTVKDYIEALISQKQIEILERVITTHDKHYVSCGCGNTATSLLKELRGE